MKETGVDRSIASESLQELEAIFNHASIGIAFTQNRIFTRCNAAMERSLGYGPGALDGTSTDALFQSRDEYARFASAIAENLKLRPRHEHCLALHRQARPSRRIQDQRHSHWVQSRRRSHGLVV